MEAKPVIYCRADGNSQIGLGHVMRSLALAEMLQEHFEIHFLVQNPSDALAAEISKIATLTILPETIDYIQEAHYIVQQHLPVKAIVILDGYHFTIEYQKIIKATCQKLVCIDDLADKPFDCDLIINHGGGIQRKDYQASANTEFCLGLAYAMLRKPFREAALRRRKEFHASQVMICMGGADPTNFTCIALDACLAESFFKKIIVVVGSAYLHKEALDARVAEHGNRVVVKAALDAEAMVTVMQSCGTAICPPSSVALEYLSVGGTLYLQTTADNQRRLFQYLIHENYALPYSLFLQRNPTTIPCELLDGQQPRRFLEVLGIQKK